MIKTSSKVSLAEKKFFFLFTVLLVVTFFFFDKFNQGHWLLFWGFYNLSRFIYLNDTPNKKIPKILNLPSRILFGLNQEKEKYVECVKRIYTSKIVLVLYAGMIFYTVHMTYDFLTMYNDLSNLIKKEILFYQFLSWLVRGLIYLNIILAGLSFYHLVWNWVNDKIGKNS